jgi:4-amino-4-deoxy-L-arabinose transferase-like glycosyltransferase
MPMMVFTFLKRLTGRDWAAFFAALLFAVHPIQVEAVSWAAALSTVLFSMFYLGSLLAYLTWRRSSKMLWLGLSLVAFLAACLSKSAAVTLPLVLLAVDYYWEMTTRPTASNRITGNLLNKIPFLATALLFGLYTLQHKGTGRPQY